MRVSAKVDYALRALTELAVSPPGYVKAERLATAQEIPLKFLEILLSPAEDAAEAMIERVVHLGFEVRIELVREDREKVWAQLTRDQCEELELADGQIVYVRAAQERVFA